MFIPLVIRPTERGLVERFGKYQRFCQPGLNWRILMVERVFRVNITEMMVDAGTQEIITNDNLNAHVDAQVYFKVKADEDSVKKSQYNVYSYQTQIVSLARTTLRNIIGTLTLRKANSERGTINSQLYTTLLAETANWGLEIVRTELKQIDPPTDVQETMNKVVKAENEKMAAVDYATAAETEADGRKRAAVKAAEGEKQAAILRAEGQKLARVLIAEGEAEAIKLVNEAAEKYFVGNAQLLRKLEATETSLKHGTKVIIPTGSTLVNVIGNLTDVAGSDGSASR